MLPPFIIEQIRRREEQERARQHEQPSLELPLPVRPAQRLPVGANVDDEPDPDRGVIVVDLG